MQFLNHYQHCENLCKKLRNANSYVHEVISGLRAGSACFFFNFTVKTVHNNTTKRIDI